jgi:hypothetical protein
MAGVADLRRLGTDPTYPEAKARRIGDLVHGHEWGVDSDRYGKPYVFARIHENAVWIVRAGPFVDEAAAVAWIEGL